MRRGGLQNRMAIKLDRLCDTVFKWLFVITLLADLLGYIDLTFIEVLLVIIVLELKEVKSCLWEN